MRYDTCVLLNRVVDLFTFPMAATGINKEDVAIALIGVSAPFSSVMYFQEILLDLKKRKEVIKHIECCDMLVECE